MSQPNVSSATERADVQEKCIAAVQAAAAALGRSKPLTAAEIKSIDDKIRSTMQYLAGKDRDGWAKMSADQRVLEASKFAAEEIVHKARRDAQNAQLQIVKRAATEVRVKAENVHTKTRSAALVHDIDHTADYISGVKMEATSHLMDLLDAVKSGDGASAGRRVAMFLFNVQNPAMTKDLAAEVFGKAEGKTGNKIAQAGARAWLDVIEALRNRFNAGGGDVGKIDYGYLPPPHDAARLRQAGREKWIQDVLPLQDRTRFLDTAGKQMNDAELRGVLSDSYTSIALEQIADDMLGVQRTTGARANRGREHRELHFKDADSYLSYVNNYGRGSMYDAMLSHIGRLSRDIGLVERYGPNPDAQMRMQFDLASQADLHGVETLPRVFGLRPQSYWDSINGAASSPQSARIAQTGTNIRNMMVFAKLGAAVVSSLTDFPSYMVTTGYMKLPYFQALTNIGKVAFNKDTRNFLTSHAIIAESMASDLNRWTNDNIKATWSGRLAQSTMKLSLMNAWTDSLRRAFSLTMMQGMARLAGKDWEGLSQWDRAHMERKGLTAEDWSVIRRAELTHFQGADHLTPESIHAVGDARSNEIVAKVLGLIQDESEYAVLNPDLATKTIATMGGTKRGTLPGELARCVMQFKSFPIAMVSRHWRRMLDSPQVTDGSAPLLANRLVYGGAMLLTSSALGALVVQIKQILSGKDPIDVTKHPVKFTTRAVAQSGGLSIVGDLLLNDPGSSTMGFAKNIGGTLAGPAVSEVAKAIAIPIEAGWKAAAGKPTTLGADVVGMARSDAPMLNLWYTRAAIDHMGMHALQENLSPGYLSRMKQQAAKDWGQAYWWQPGTGGPDRAPDLGKAVGE